MEKVEIKLTIEAERLDALKFFLSAKEHTTPQKELEKLLKELYEKYVPADTREYLDSKLKPSPPPRPRPKRPTNVNPNPAFGSTAYVVDTIYSTGSEPVGAASGISAQFWSAMYPGYGIEYTETVGGETIYHFIYVGNDWEFTVNGVKPVDPVYKDADGNPYQLYMDQYTVKAGDEVVLDYCETVTRWTDTDNWLTE